MPMSERTCRSRRPRAAVTFAPPTWTLPCEGTTRLFTVRIRVDLPAPERPTTTRNWPRGIERVTPLRAFRPVLYVTSTSRNSMWDTDESNPEDRAGAGLSPGRPCSSGGGLRRPPAPTSLLLEGAADLAHDVVDGGVIDARELGHVEEGLGERLALGGVGDVDERLGDLLLEPVVEVRHHDHAVVGDVGRVAEDADLLLDVGVVGLDRLAPVGAGGAAEGDGHVDVAEVHGEHGGVVRAREDAGHLGVGVDAVLVAQGHVRELVAGGGAGVDPGDRLAAQVVERF